MGGKVRKLRVVGPVAMAARSRLHVSILNSYLDLIAGGKMDLSSKLYLNTLLTGLISTVLHLLHRQIASESDSKELVLLQSKLTSLSEGIPMTKPSNKSVMN